MSVASELGLGAGLDSAALTAASKCWPRWAAAEVSLAGPEGPDGVEDLVPWLRTAGPAEADRVLLALVRLGSPAGGDEPLAVDVVAWALLPGARVLARRLRGLGADVDRLVAAQLWLEVRTFPWERLEKVAANVLANTRAHLLAADLPMDRDRRGAAACRLVDPHSLLWERVGASDAAVSAIGRPTADVELREVLGDATDFGVLAASERDLLRVVVEQAHEVGGGARRGRGGLLADRVVSRVVAVTGLSPATVRRRVRRSVVAIAQAQRAGLIEAA